MAAIQTYFMKITAFCPALLAVFVSTIPVVTYAQGTSSAEDRARFVSVVQNLERAPLDAALGEDRKWAIDWLEETPDITVSVCSDSLGDVVFEKSYSHGPEILVQYMLAMASFVIEHPEKANDPDARQLAGVESALRAYRSIRGVQSANQSKALEPLLDLQDQRELSGFVRKAYARCLANSAKSTK